MSTRTQKKYFCYICNQEIIFKLGQRTTNRTGRIVPKRFNTDGADHVCTLTNQQGIPRSIQRQTNYRTLRRNISKNTNYHELCRESITGHNQHRNISTLEALQILQLTKSVLALRPIDRVREMNRTFWKLVLRFHPARKHISSEANEEIFRKIKDAYDSLLR